MPEPIELIIEEIKDVCTNDDGELDPFQVDEWLQVKDCCRRLSNKKVL